MSRSEVFWRAKGYNFKSHKPHAVTDSQPFTTLCGKNLTSEYTYAGDPMSHQTCRKCQEAVDALS